MLGELRKKVDILLEPHKLSLYNESTPWRHFLLSNRFTVSVTVSLMIILTASYVVQKNTRLNLLQENITRTEKLIKTELRRVLPKNSATGINKMMIELQENIKNRKEYIETSNKFEKRE